ncbi:MAG: hypothetical protein H0T42_31420 [Deltaproteobacteria bacterium]|nr:hypothetical protein [Deltaproteobacteria bacterium]
MIVVAALATIATSRQAWVVEATPVVDELDQARMYVVEASHEPHVSMHSGSNYENRRPLGVPTWPGKASYLIPAGAVIGRVFISEKCTGGSCKTCKPPADAKVRIEAITPVGTWTLEARKSPTVQPTVMPPNTWTTYRVVVEASHHVRLRVESTGPAGTVSEYGYAHHIDFGIVQAVTTFTWSVIATIEQPCADLTKPCEPPADARISIEAIIPESRDAP